MAIKSLSDFPDRIYTRHAGHPHTLEYKAWRNMMQRCYNPNIKDYRNYGNRGINVHMPWHRFQKFIADRDAEIGPRPSPRHSLDRIDNDGNYEPGNIRWATPPEQARNKRYNGYTPEERAEMREMDQEIQRLLIKLRTT